MVVFVNSHSSSINNPCPTGTGIGYGTFNGTIFLICDASFPHNPPVDTLGLGLGLGLGIPAIVIVIILWNLAWNNKWWCYKNRFVAKLSPEEVVKTELPPEYLDMFRSGKLNVMLKKKLFMIHEQKGQPLNDYVKYAEELNKPELVNWIKNITFTTLQDEGIV